MEVSIMEEERKLFLEMVKYANELDLVLVTDKRFVKLRMRGKKCKRHEQTTKIKVDTRKHGDIICYLLKTEDGYPIAEGVVILGVTKEEGDFFVTKSEGLMVFKRYIRKSLIGC